MLNSSGLTTEAAWYAYQVIVLFYLLLVESRKLQYFQGNASVVCGLCVVP